MEKIIKQLMKFGFTKIEAMVYIELLKQKEENGSKLAKELNLPRTSVYAALDVLCDRGAVFMLPAKVNKYKAENPNILFANLEKELSEASKFLKEKLKKFKNEETLDQYWNINSEESLILKTKEYLESAKKEIYINTNYPLNVFEKEIENIIKKGVRIILFSFGNYEVKNTKIEFYKKTQLNEKEAMKKRIMLVVDDKKVLVASGYLNGDFVGTFTNNDLLVDIIAEHIHNDIYLLKLEDKHGNNWFKQMKLKTLNENKFEIKYCKNTGEKNE